jgi:hypothetical protein
VDDERNTLISCFIETFFLQVGHVLFEAIAIVMHFLQKMWPHLVDISSTKGSIHIGQIKSSSFGGSDAFSLGSTELFLGYKRKY